MKGLSSSRCGGRSLSPLQCCSRCVCCSAKLWVMRAINNGSHVRAQCCFTELQDGLGLKTPQRSSAFRTMLGRHILLVSSSKTKGSGPHSPSGCAQFLGLCHCLISSSLLFSALLPAREWTQELFQGLSKDSWQVNQDLNLC